MKINIHTCHFSLTTDLHAYIHRGVRFVLGTRDEHIERVVVRLSDDSDELIGEDQYCQIQVTLPGSADVIVENIEAEMLVAIDRAIDQVGCAVSRHLTRHSDREYAPWPPQRPETTELETLY